MRKYLLVGTGFAFTFIFGMYFQSYWAAQKDAVTQTKEKQPSYWVAPMDPTYRRDKPGKSPMGMDLVPVYADDEAGGGTSIKISPVIEQNLGVRTAPVTHQDLSLTIETVGYVTANENRIKKVNTYTDGWVKRLAVKTTGEHVAKGQLLFQIYSPTLINAQEEYLLALKSNNAAIQVASYRKLQALGLSEAQILRIKETQRITKMIEYYAEQAGIIAKLELREGVYVKPGQDLMTIEDLSSIWVLGEVFERESQWVQQGQRAVVRLPYFPGKWWEGTVDYVYPQLDPNTHTLKTRLRFDNPKETLKPNMYADITIFSGQEQGVLTIPREAVIYTGEGARVVVSLGKGIYRVRSIKLGLEAEGRIVVLAGLKRGERVVTSAQFLIDSESNLKADLGRMQNEREPTVNQQQ
ncbi:MAG: efflux RND transporter periplasmic adaptor subunit [Pseudomonadota bacterium]